MIFGISYDSYVTTREERTTIQVDYKQLSDPNQPMACKMLSFKSTTVASPSAPDWWRLGCMVPGFGLKCAVHA